MSAPPWLARSLHTGTHRCSLNISLSLQTAWTWMQWMLGQL